MINLKKNKFLFTLTICFLFLLIAPQVKASICCGFISGCELVSDDVECTGNGGTSIGTCDPPNQCEAIGGDTYGCVCKSYSADNPLALAGMARVAAGLSDPGLPSVISVIIWGALSLVGAIFLILIIYGGFLWMTASGNEEQIGKAKKILASSIIGLAIILLSGVITYALSKFFEEQTLK